MVDDPETFEGAVARFREVLWERGVAGELIWVEPEDLLLTGSQRYFVRPARSEANAARAREVFGSRTGMHAGVGFRAVAFAPEGVCCCVVRRRAAGVNYSVPIEEARVEAVAVRGRWRWRWLRWKYRKAQEMREMLFRE